MSIWIEKDENDATARRVPCRIFTSNGTAPDTGAQGDAVIMAVHSITTISLSSALTAIHAAQGMYQAQLTASEVSLLGTHMLYHIAGDFPQHIATIQVVNSNPFSTLSAISNVTLHAGTHSDVTIKGIQNYANISNVTLHAGTHSNATIQGISNYANISNVTLHAGTHSNVTIQGVTRVNSGVTLNADTHSGATIKGIENYANFPLTSVATSVWSTLRSNFTTPGSFGEYVYSQVTGTSTGTVKGVENYANISNVTLHAGTHSNVTIQGVTRVNSGVTLNANTHSGATIQGLTNYANISNVTLHAGVHSGATVAVNDIAPAVYSGVSVEVRSGGIQAASLGAGTLTSAKFAAGAIDAAALATDAGQEVADALLGRNIAGGSSTGRIVSEALYPLRNRSLIQGSVGTVYQVDDATSSWTFSPSLGTAPIAGIDPLGP